MLKVPMVDAVWAKRVQDLPAQAGRPAAGILHQAGIERARIETSGGRILFARHAALLEAAAVELADDLFGLHFGLTRDPRDAGLIAYVTSTPRPMLTPCVTSSVTCGSSPRAISPMRRSTVTPSS
jgi:Arabinose-binding domain of AraC transcription regulator, N-term